MILVCLKGLVSRIPYPRSPGRLCVGAAPVSCIQDPLAWRHCTSCATAQWRGCLSWHENLVLLVWIPSNSSHSSSTAVAAQGHSQVAAQPSCHTGITVLEFNTVIPWNLVSWYIAVHGRTRKYQKALCHWIRVYTGIHEGTRPSSCAAFCCLIQGYRTFGYFLVLQCTAMYQDTGFQGITVLEIRIKAGMYYSTCIY